MEIGPKGDVPKAAEFFRQPPFRWLYFLADTAILIMSTGVCMYVMIRYRAQLSSSAEIVLAAAILGMILLWKAALRSHSRLHKFLQVDGIREIDSDSALEAALKVAASMTHLGLFYTFLLVALLVMQFDRLLARR